MSQIKQKTIRELKADDKKPLPHGNKTIRLTIAFWASKDCLKIARPSGVVYIQANRSRGIQNKDNFLAHFDDPSEIPRAAKEVLKHSKIALVKQEDEK